MSTAANSVRRFCRDTRGLSTVEYVLLLVLIAAGSITAWKNFGKSVVGQVDGQTKAIKTLK